VSGSRYRLRDVGYKSVFCDNETFLYFTGKQTEVMGFLVLSNQATSMGGN
jgi:hypothetical protein